MRSLVTARVDMKSVDTCPCKKLSFRIWRLDVKPGTS